MRIPLLLNIQNNEIVLMNKGLLERVSSDKNDYWRVMQPKISPQNNQSLGRSLINVLLVPTTTTSGLFAR